MSLESKLQMSVSRKKERWRQVGCVQYGNHGIWLKTTRGFADVPVAIYCDLHPVHSLR